MSTKILNIPKSGICLVSLSENNDHQNTLYGMFNALCEEYDVHTVGSDRVVVPDWPITEHNHYMRCPGRPGITRGTFDLLQIRRIVDAIRHTGCKTVYFESVHLWNCAIMALLGSGFTKISTLHDVVPHDGSKSVYLCQRLQTALSDYVVVKSPEFIQDAARLYHIEKNRIVVFGVWRDYPPYQEALGDGSFLFFGRLRRYKGLNGLLRLANSCPDAHFKVVGAPDEESRATLGRLASLPNVEVRAERVSDSEMEDLFRSSSWTVLPYESASQSGVIIDSYKYGRPVIAYEVGAIASQVSDGRSGFLVPTSNAVEFSDAIRRAQAVSTDDYISMCRQAYDFGYGLYATQAVSGAFAELFNIAEVTHK